MLETQTPPCGGAADGASVSPSHEQDGESLAHPADIMSSGHRLGRGWDAFKRASHARPAWGTRRSATEPGPHHAYEVVHKRVSSLCMEDSMTQTEAEQCAGWIQKAFPHMKMTPRLYVRALVHYDAEMASAAILDAISNVWKRMPNVAEVVEVVKSCMPPSSTAACVTCEGDRLVHVGDFDYAPCPDCHALSGTDYFLVGAGSNYHAGAAARLELRALDPAKVRELMER